jgi:hypothetical protein
MLSIEGRKAATIDEAKNFIKRFMYEIIHLKNESGYVKHYELDLYLPMMMDWVLNVPGDKNQTFTPTDTLEVLYMDAAWELCREGIFRPGPRATNGESPHDSYGKGYSLTLKGREWIKEAPSDPSPDTA